MRTDALQDKFDRAEIRAVNTLAEADYFFKQHKDAPTRQEFAESLTKRIKAVIRRIVLREGKL